MIRFARYIQIYAALVGFLVITMPTTASAFNDDVCEKESQMSHVLDHLQPFLTDFAAHQNFERSLQFFQHKESDAYESSVDKKVETSKDQCIGELKDDELQNNACFLVVDTPISTGPKLFTKFQAKRAANLIFKGVNVFYRKVDEKIMQEKQAQGYAKSSQPKDDDFYERPDAIILKRLVPVRVAITRYFAQEKKNEKGPSCHYIKHQQVTCERLPYDAPSPFHIAMVNNTVGILPAKYSYQFIVETEVEELFYPDVDELRQQNFHEVAKPPPEKA